MCYVPEINDRSQIHKPFHRQRLSRTFFLLLTSAEARLLPEATFPPVAWHSSSLTIKTCKQSCICSLIPRDPAWRIPRTIWTWSKLGFACRGLWVLISM